MPLQLVFHLELARPSTITTVWDIANDRFEVIAIDDNDRIIKELAAHADEAGLSETYRSNPQFPLIPELYRHLRIEQNSTVGVHNVWGEVRIFMEKPDGSHTNAWVWKDNIRWIEVQDG